MMYTTMTRGKVLRLIARGWYITLTLSSALKKKTDYYEVGIIKKGVLHGEAYQP